MTEGQQDVSWETAAIVSSLAIGLVVTAVGMTFFAIMIFASLSLAKVRIVRRFFVNFGVGFLASFLNLFLLFGAVFAFPAVVINTCLVTFIYAIDLATGFQGRPGVKAMVQRYLLYVVVAAVSTVAGACLVKYIPGVLHKRDEVPPLDWEKDFKTWEGLGGWLFVNLLFGSLSLLFGAAAETWLYRRDVAQSLTEKQKND